MSAIWMTWAVYAYNFDLANSTGNPPTMTEDNSTASMVPVTFNYGENYDGLKNSIGSPPTTTEDHPNVLGEPVLQIGAIVCIVGGVIVILLAICMGLRRWRRKIKSLRDADENEMNTNKCWLRSITLL